MAINRRLEHDTAFALTTALLDIVRNRIRKEERRDAFEVFYQACLAGIEAHDIRQQRMRMRLHPFNN
jgi:hypothetical protein